MQDIRIGVYKKRSGLYDDDTQYGTTEIELICSCGHVQKNTYNNVYNVPTQHTCSVCGNKVFHQVSDKELVYDEDGSTKLLLPTVWDVEASNTKLKFSLSNISFTLSKDKTIKIIKKNKVRKLDYDLIKGYMRIYAEYKATKELEFEFVYGSHVKRNFDSAKRYIFKHISTNDLIAILGLSDNLMYLDYHNKQSRQPLNLIDRVYCLIKLKPRALKLETIYASGIDISNIGKDFLRRNIVFNYGATKPHEMFGIPKTIFNSMKSNGNVNFSSINSIQRFFRMIEENNTKYAEESYYDLVILLLRDNSLAYITSQIMELVSLNYEPKKLYKYLNNIGIAQGISVYNAINILKDYANMSNLLKMNNYERYPKSLKLKHDITDVIYRANKRTIDEDRFKFVVSQDEYKELKYKSSGYSVIIPETADDIKEEGSVLGHCVASYVDNIMNKKTKIAFLRNLKDISVPLVTLEVSNGALVQARGRFNRSVKDDERQFLSKFCKSKNIEMRV